MTELDNALYLYENHLGGLYTSDEKYDFDYLYCETCGDSDTYLGEFKTIKEFWDLVKDECFDIHYLFAYMVKVFELPDTLMYKDKAHKCVYECCNSTRYINNRMKELLGDDFEWNEELWGEINGNIITRRLS